MAPGLSVVGATDPFIALQETGHHGPAKPSSSLLQRLKLVLDGQTAITGADLDIQGGASGQCCHSRRVSRIANPSMEKNLGLGLIDVLITP